MSASPCPTCGGNRTEAFSASKTVTIPVFVPVEEVKITVVGPGAVVKKGTVVPVAAMVD